MSRGSKGQVCFAVFSACPETVWQEEALFELGRCGLPATRPLESGYRKSRASLDDHFRGTAARRRDSIQDRFLMTKLTLLRSTPCVTTWARRSHALPGGMLEAAPWGLPVGLAVPSRILAARGRDSSSVPARTLLGGLGGPAHRGHRRTQRGDRGLGGAGRG